MSIPLIIWSVHRNTEYNLRYLHIPSIVRGVQCKYEAEHGTALEFCHFANVRDLRKPYSVNQSRFVLPTMVFDTVLILSILRNF